MKMVVKKAGSPEELEKILRLRVKILRDPWGQSAASATDEHEDRSVNAYIEDASLQVVACGRLQENAGKTGQIRFMAVEESQQGKGLGALIVQFLENEARSMGLKAIELQARENTLSFYKKMGYQVVEKSFLLWGEIQHYLMSKQL
jgi:N-acetylglutamate synthase-like GNAT family acetyltransferase